MVAPALPRDSEHGPARLLRRRHPAGQQAQHQRMEDVINA
jgi:hypothetical protein